MYACACVCVYIERETYEKENKIVRACFFLSVCIYVRMYVSICNYICSMSVCNID